MAIKKNDFVQIEFDAYDDKGNLFDTTNKENAIKNKIFNDPKKIYGPITICVGLQQVIKGLDDSFIGKDENSNYSIDILPEYAFGKKNPKLIQIVNKNVFLKNKIQPYPNMQVNVDGIFGIIRTVNGGRVTVDFNHPLAGKVLRYNVKILKIITDLKDKINGFLKLTLNTTAEKINEKNKECNVIIKTKINKDILNNIAKRLGEILNINLVINAID